MRKEPTRGFQLGVAIFTVEMVPTPLYASAQTEAGLLSDALSAAWPGRAGDARVIDWEGNVSKEASNGFTCLPT